MTVLYSVEATLQLDALQAHYEALDRIEATRNLDRALDEAEQRIETRPEAGFAAPRPYPELAEPGEAWIKAGRYWIGYTRAEPPVIFAVFHETVDIPGRL